jgi:asparagine synthetase B (glutamine-hydrolysing)
MFEGCSKLPPAQIIFHRYKSNNIISTACCYWTLDTRQIHNGKDATAALTDCIEKSIDRHMVADVPVSSF